MFLVLAEAAAKSEGINWTPIIVAVGTCLTGMVTAFTGFGRWVLGRLDKAENAATQREQDCHKVTNQLREEHKQLQDETIKVVVDALNRNTKAFEDSQVAQRKMMGMLGDLKKSSYRTRAIEAKNQNKE